MRSRIVKIGNSQGVRIPKPLLDQAGLSGEVELDVRQNQIVIHAPQRAREGWDDAFARMAAEGDDAELDPFSPNEWDHMEWEW